METEFSDAWGAGFLCTGSRGVVLLFSGINLSLAITPIPPTLLLAPCDVATPPVVVRCAVLTDSLRRLSLP